MAPHSTTQCDYNRLVLLRTIIGDCPSPLIGAASTLMWFCRHHDKTLADIVEAAQAADDSPEVPTVIEHKLLGLLPLDPNDEGLNPVGIEASVADIFNCFENAKQQSEVAVARRLI